MKKKLCFFLLFVWATNFLVAQSAYSDCSSALIICSKGTYLLDELSGGGTDLQEVNDNTCLGQNFTEKNSSWIKWEVGEPGFLEFKITPLDLNSDIDFVLYQIEKGGTECTDEKQKKAVRCIASGRNLGDLVDSYKPCLGPTGIRKEARDVEEFKGCVASDDNFAAPIHVVAGESYALFIHNNSDEKGVLFEIEGSGELKLERQLIIEHQQENQEDQNLQQDISTFQSHIKGGVVNGLQTWSFGADAIPAHATGSGPHKVTFHSSGMKNIQSSIQTNEGCQLNAVYQLDVLSSTFAINSNDQGFTIFPNPTTDQVFIQRTNSEGKEWARIYLVDVLGKVQSVDTRFLGNAPLEMDTSGLTPGAYFIRLEIGEKSYLQKLIKI